MKKNVSAQSLFWTAPRTVRALFGALFRYAAGLEAGSQKKGTRGRAAAARRFFIRPVFSRGTDTA